MFTTRAWGLGCLDAEAQDRGSLGKLSDQIARLSATIAPVRFLPKVTTSPGSIFRSHSVKIEQLTPTRRWRPGPFGGLAPAVLTLWLK